MPGQRDNLPGFVFINSLNVSYVDRRVVASVLLTERIVVKALTN